MTDSDASMFRHPHTDDPLARLNAEPNKSCILNVDELISKLERVKQEKDQGEAMRDGLERLPHPSTDHAQLLAAVCEKIGPVLDDSEDILDAHLSRVGFSPKSLSGVTSPCQGPPPKVLPRKRMPPPILEGFNNINSLPKCKSVVYLICFCIHRFNKSERSFQLHKIWNRPNHCRWITRGHREIHPSTGRQRISIAASACGRLIIRAKVGIWV